MKAALLREVGSMEITDVPVPECPPDGLLMRVHSCAVCGTDVKVYRHGHRLIVPPRITGHELAGEIVEVGKDVTGFEVGHRVAVAPAVPCGKCRYCRGGIQSMCDDLTAIGYMYDGGFAEFMAVPPLAVANGCVNSVPENVSYEEASLAEPLACCINAHELAWVGLGQTVVVIGAGPIGCLNVQLARARGATRTILVDISDRRLKLSRWVNADLCLNSSEEDATARIMDETEGVGADIVIVACSSGKAQEQALDMVAKRGVVNFFGGLPKDDPYINFNSNLAHYREFYVVGNHGSTPRQNALALDLIAAGKIDARSLITHRLNISRTIEGIEITERGEGLKVLIGADYE